MSETPIPADPPPEKFAERVIARLHRAGVEEPIKFEPEGFVLRRESGGATYLHNVYRDYCSAPRGERMGVIARFVQGMLEGGTDGGLPETFDEAKANLLPRIRDRGYYALTPMRLALDGHGDLAFVTRPLSRHFGVEIVFDRPRSIASLPESMYEDWGVPFDDALAVARANLLAQSPLAFDSPIPGVYVSAWRDSHDASRLLLTEMILSLEVKGAPVALIPTRDHLFVTGLDDEEGLEAVGSVARAVIEEASRPMSGHALRLEGDEWVPYLPPWGHPAHKAFRELQLHTLLADYAEQKELLDALNEQDDVDVFVGTPQAFCNEATSEYTIVSTWTAGVPTLLGEADKIALVKDGGGEDELETVGIGDWARVRAVAGELMTDMGVYPPRYRVTRFPTPELLEAMDLTPTL